VKVPGLANIWIPPIRNRIDMLATGIKSPIGVKVTGSDLATIDRIAQGVERVAKTVPGVSSALAERLTGGRYIDVQIDRAAAARYGLNIADVQAVVSGAIGGENVGETVEGLARFPINLRYPREWRDTPERLAALPVLTPMGQQITLGTVAKIVVADGPPMLKSENARPSGWVYVDVRGRDLASVAADLRAAVAREVKLAPGVSIAYSGQFEYLERANARLKIVVPATLMIIFVLLYLTFRRIDEAVLIMATLPFALTGGVWFLWAMGYHLSIATGVGFIALAGVAAEFGVVMLLYLKHALEATGWPRHAADAAGGARRHPRRRGAARAAQGDDGGGDPGRPGAHRLGQRHGLGGDEPHRRADARRHGHRAAAVAVRGAGGVRAAAISTPRLSAGLTDEGWV
jgi:Cu(I)/Ag(I) efflux system membrane protein CusA/SilA